MPNRQPHLLYIDDDRGLCRLVEIGFRRLGYRVSLAGSGAEGIEKLQAGHDVDVVALDHHMEGLNGLETLALIQHLPNPPPVVFVTGEVEGRVAISALKAGAADYVIKEASADFQILLEAAIATAVEMQRQRRLRERAEAELLASRDRFEALANERAILIHEVNHRVSNSLQLIASLLLVQSGAQQEPQAAEILLDAYKRVTAVGNVHKRLYRSDDVRFVDLADYLRGLIEDLRQSVDQRRNTLQFLASETRIGTDIAVPVGLIVTELVLNAMKYAYGDEGGPIRVSAERNGRSIVFVVEDDGIGISEEVWRRGRGIGNRIVVAMVEKIGGLITVSGARGTRVEITFESDDPAAADGMATRDSASVLIVADSIPGERRYEQAAAGGPIGSLLLVEDDPMMRTVVAGNLEALGFTVIEAASAADVRSCLAAASDIRAALIDVGLPDARGDQLVVDLRQRLPGLPVILASGYDEKTLAERFQADPMTLILPKPYSIEALTAALQALAIAPGGGLAPAGAQEARLN
jgi:two-component sensor histidine kinase/CheY-like chemotaxis protein